jgi:flagellar assembly protein FliH
MSCRLGGDREKQAARPVDWPVLAVSTTSDTLPPQTEELRQRFAEAVEEAGQLRRQLQELEDELPSKERSGYERGLAEGRVRGREEALQQQQPVLDRMVRAIGDLAMLRSRLRVQNEAGLIRLCTAIAHRVLRRELHLDPLALEGIVAAALSRAGMEEACRIRVHPRQANAVRAYLLKLGAPQTVTVEPVSSLDEGDVLVETSAGTIDASVNTQIAEVEHGITARLGA